uniref:PilS cassette n=1 Tax=Romanomermis culicivorax TaxID=13658 RepID=A0A915JB71_ROMCU
MQLTERNRRERKFPFHSVWLDVTVGRFPQICSYPFRSK